MRFSGAGIQMVVTMMFCWWLGNTAEKKGWIGPPWGQGVDQRPRRVQTTPQRTEGVTLGEEGVGGQGRARTVSSQEKTVMRLRRRITCV